MMALQRFVNRSSGLLGKTPDSSLEALGLTSICPSHYHRSLDSNACHGQRFVFRIATCLLAAGFPVTSCGGIIVDPAQSSMRRRDLQPTLISLFRSTFMQDLARSSWPSICVIADASPKGKIDEPQLKHLPTRANRPRGGGHVPNRPRAVNCPRAACRPAVCRWILLRSKSRFVHSNVLKNHGYLLITWQTI